MVVWRPVFIFSHKKEWVPERVQGVLLREDRGGGVYRIITRTAGALSSRMNGRNRTGFVRECVNTIKRILVYQQTLPSARDMRRNTIPKKKNKKSESKSK